MTPPALDFPVRLGPDDPFPDPRSASPEGWVAVGGGLGVPRLLAAYRAGIFPWSARPVTWWSPDPRGILPLDGFRVSRSLARVRRREVYRVTWDEDFAGVVAGCAASAPGREQTWISPELAAAYLELHRAGHAHSVECRAGETRVGGVYGVAVGGLFAGESMFHRATDASKVALWHLVERLRAGGFALFDVQQVTPATAPLGAVAIPRGEYLDRLAAARELPARFTSGAAPTGGTNLTNGRHGLH